jgi:microcystin-dependent protein
VAISLKHSFESPKADGTDSTLVQPSNWNAEHAISLAAGKVIGRVSGSAGAAQELPLAFDSTLQSMIPPVGTTAERPVTPAAGMMRYNSTTLKLEIYTNGEWTPVGGSAKVSATAPTSPQPGDLWYNSTTGQLQTYSGSAWVLSNNSVGVNVFSGTGSQTAFTLSSAPGSANNTEVYVSGVYQRKATYSVSGTTLTFSVAPASGSSNIEVLAYSTVNIGTPSDDTVSTAKLQDSAVTTVKIADGAVELAKLAASLQQLFVPSGSITAYAGASAPTGWLLCFGQAVSRTTYATLFSAIGTTYGVGDNSTTFNLPDLRGRTLAGKDNMGGSSANRLTGLTGGVAGSTLGAVGGVEAHTLSITEMPSHDHTYNGGNARHGYNGTEGLPFKASDGDSSDGTSPTMTVTSTGGGGAHNNVQPTMIANYIIKV